MYKHTFGQQGSMGHGLKSGHGHLMNTHETDLELLPTPPLLCSLYHAHTLICTANIALFYHISTLDDVKTEPNLLAIGVGVRWVVFRHDHHILIFLRLADHIHPVAFTHSIPCFGYLFCPLQHRSNLWVKTS